MNLNLFQKIMLIWLIISSVFWVIYISFFEFIYGMIYYFFIITIVLIPILVFKDLIINKLQNLYYNDFIKFMSIGYIVVLFEEFFAASLNHLSEGFSLILWIQRIGQFWLFNLFAFTGFYLAWYFLLKRYKYTYIEIFFLAEVWGLFSERVISNLLI